MGYLRCVLHSFALPLVSGMPVYDRFRYRSIWLVGHGFFLEDILALMSGSLRSSARVHVH